MPGLGPQAVPKPKPKPAQGASDAPFTRAAAVADVPEGTTRCLEVDGRPVMLIHAAGGTFRAIENLCSHEKKSFEGARIRGGKKIVCPHHGANFDLETGKALNPPAVLPITIFPVKVEDGDIYIQLVEGVKRPANPFAVPGSGM